MTTTLKAPSMLRSMSNSGSSRTQEQGKARLPEAIATLEKALQELRKMTQEDVKTVALSWSWDSSRVGRVRWAIEVERYHWHAVAVSGDANDE